MRSLALVVRTSLDGFVAASKGELNGFPSGEENLEFVCKLTKKRTQLCSEEFPINCWIAIGQQPLSFLTNI